jgi:hypothetical protein
MEGKASYYDVVVDEKVNKMPPGIIRNRPQKQLKLRDILRFGISLKSLIERSI